MIRLLSMTYSACSSSCAEGKKTLLSATHPFNSVISCRLSQENAIWARPKLRPLCWHAPCYQIKHSHMHLTLRTIPNRNLFIFPVTACSSYSTQSRPCPSFCFNTSLIQNSDSEVTQADRETHIPAKTDSEGRERGRSCLDWSQDGFPPFCVFPL